MAYPTHWFLKKIFSLFLAEPLALGSSQPGTTSKSYLQPPPQLQQYRILNPLHGAGSAWQHHGDSWVINPLHPSGNSPTSFIKPLSSALHSVIDLCSANSSHSYKWLFKFKLMKIKWNFSFLSQSYQPHPRCSAGTCVSGCHTGPCICGAFHQEVLLAWAALHRRACRW